MNDSWLNRKSTHFLAAILGLVAFGLIYTYSGDADLLYALSGSAVLTVIAYFILWLRSRK